MTKSMINWKFRIQYKNKEMLWLLNVLDYAEIVLLWLFGDFWWLTMTLNYLCMNKYNVYIYIYE